MAHTLTIDFNRPIALFPLASCVLLPHATVPLHIFEPRYRAMVRDAIDSSGIIAMATFDGEAYKADYHGGPPIRSHLCVGYIAHHERLADGRYNMLLQGVARARLLEEVEPHADGYRRAILRPTEQGMMEIDLESHRKRMEELLGDEHLNQLAAIRNVNNWLSPEMPTPAVVDLTWQAVACDSEERYAALAEPCVLRRAAKLERCLERTRRTLAIAQQMGPCMSETGLPLN